MSTILEVLRKAQEDARKSQAPRPRRIEGTEVPEGMLGIRPRRRVPRSAWLALAIALLGGAVAGLLLTEGVRVPRQPEESDGGGPGRAQAVAREPRGDAPGTAGAGVGSGAADERLAAAGREKAGGDAPPSSRPGTVGAPGAATATGASAVAAGPPAAAPPAVASAPAVAAPPSAAAAPKPARAPAEPAARALPPEDVAQLPSVSGAVGREQPPDYLVPPEREGEPMRLRPIPRSRRPSDEELAAAAGAMRKPLPQPEDPPTARPVVRRAAPEQGAVAAATGTVPAAPAGVPAGAPSGAGELLPAEAGGEPAAVAPAAARAVAPPEVRHAPAGLPDVSINVVQWSPVEARRFAFVRIDGSSMVKVREGDEVGGLVVRRILPQAIEFATATGSFVLRAN